MGREVLEDVELDALKAWLRVVSDTFPGAVNRRVLSSLALELEPLALLDFDMWDAMLKRWQRRSPALIRDELQAVGDSVAQQLPEWQRLDTLFVGRGATYRGCASYTCGQWALFHMLTVNPLPSSEAPAQDQDPERPVAVIAAIRRFVKHFFGCQRCRDHFLEEHTLDAVARVNASSDRPTALKRWLWEAHNSVNRRLKHPVWPKPESCPACGDDAHWRLDQVDAWLDSTYGYRDELPASLLLRDGEGINAAGRKEARPGPLALHNVRAGSEERLLPSTWSLSLWYIVPLVAACAYFVWMRQRRRLHLHAPLERKNPV
ncbi:hypothetical protein PINS_up004271 [Pythium insidiosum]|nr:hypothetical protein PINS_up004271 [Pythium insidiosum]